MVRVSASEVIGVEVLPPIITRLRRQHPHLKVELVLSNRLLDLLQLEADIAVRMVRPSQEQLLAKRIGVIEVGLHAFALQMDTWVTMHEDLRNSPRCRVTFDALVAGLQHYVQD